MLGYRSSGIKSVFSIENLCIQAVFGCFALKRCCFARILAFNTHCFSIYSDFFGFTDAVS